MTLHDYAKSFLLRIHAWAVRNRDYWGDVNDVNKRQLDYNWNFVRYRFDLFLKKFRGE